MGITVRDEAYLMSMGGASLSIISLPNRHFNTSPTTRWALYDQEHSTRCHRLVGPGFEFKDLPQDNPCMHIVRVLFQSVGF
jgi:hypothetical protein